MEHKGRSHSRFYRRTAKISLSVLVGVYLAACSSPHGESTDISHDQVVGIWQNAEVGKIDFQGDHHFTTAGLKFEKSVLDDCERGLTSGSWTFYDQGDHGVGDWAKTSGSTLGLDFDGGKVDCFFNLNAHISNGQINLCVTTDPDAVCGNGVTFSKTAQATRRSS
ncbi:hypothetical protein AB0M29_41320 [Streptomyces sp. NPDC051976]|uniref:hypothetical protein n=1 Tax=Streptomyces sp. NPDC051976 TaxID=3154947 RepID=UPI00341DED91